MTKIKYEHAVTIEERPAKRKREDVKPEECKSLDDASRIVTDTHPTYHVKLLGVHLRSFDSQGGKGAAERFAGEMNAKLRAWARTGKVRP